MSEIMPIVIIVIELTMIAYLYNKATRQKKTELSAALHVFEEDGGVSLELISLVPIEDLLSKKEFIACVIKHDRRYLDLQKEEEKHGQNIETTS